MTDKHTNGQIQDILVHSWFISVVDSNELCPVWSVQVNQSKYENHENEGAMGGHDVFFLAKYPFSNFFFGIPCAQLGPFPYWSGMTKE